MITGIIGMDRGGTSAVAAVVKALGVTMHGSDMTLDDTELWGSRADRAAVMAGRVGDWAWKYPHRPDHTEEKLPQTDRYILVFRDPAARGMHNRDLNTVTPERIADGLEFMQRVLLLYKTGKPVCFVSYEKLLTKTPEMVQVIADFVGKPVTPLAISVVDHQKGYQNVTDMNTGVLQ